MIAEKNKYMSEAAAEMYERNADEIIREQCLAREEYLRHERMVKQQVESLQKALLEKDQALSEKDQAIAERDRELAEDKRIIAELQAKLGNQ